MFLKRSWKGVLLNGLVIVLLLSLPLIAAAQTTGTSGATATAATTNGITSPKDMAALSGTVEVRGYASNADFMKWQLDLLPNNNPNAAIFLALGETAGEFTHSLDTSKLPAGEHSLRLRVVRNDSNYDEYLTRFTIGGAASGSSATPAATATSAVTSTTTMTATTPAATATPAATSGAGATAGAGVTSNGLAAPREGQNVSGQFVVSGYANDPDFMKWQLDLLPGGNPNQAAFLSFGESTGVFTYTLNATNLPAGQHALRLRVVRNDSNYSEYTTNFTIGGGTATSGAGTASGGTTGVGATTAVTSTTTTSAGTTRGATSGAGTTGATATTNGISAPKDGATVSGPLQITGYASSPDFMKWQLDLLVGGSENQAGFLAFGETAGAVSYTLDTTMLPAGEHALRLRVVRNDSNYDEYVVKFTLTK